MITFVLFLIFLFVLCAPVFAWRKERRLRIQAEKKLEATKKETEAQRILANRFF